LFVSLRGYVDELLICSSWFPLFVVHSVLELFVTFPFFDWFELLEFWSFVLILFVVLFGVGRCLRACPPHIHSIDAGIAFVPLFWLFLDLLRLLLLFIDWSLLLVVTACCCSSLLTFSLFWLRYWVLRWLFCWLFVILCFVVLTLLMMQYWFYICSVIVLHLLFWAVYPFIYCCYWFVDDSIGTCCVIPLIDDRW